MNEAFSESRDGDDRKNYMYTFFFSLSTSAARLHVGLQWYTVLGRREKQVARFPILGWPLQEGARRLNERMRISRCKVRE